MNGALKEAWQASRYTPSAAQSLVMAALAATVACSAWTAGIGGEPTGRNTAAVLLITVFAVQVIMLNAAHVYEHAQSHTGAHRPALFVSLLARTLLITLAATAIAAAVLRLPEPQPPASAGAAPHAGHHTDH